MTVNLQVITRNKPCTQELSLAAARFADSRWAGFGWPAAGWLAG
eukprot:SAG11_NODE_36983_length_259_cov_0.618750_1_plen_43_part_01